MIIKKKINEWRKMEHTLIRKYDEGVLNEEEYKSAIEEIKNRISQSNEEIKNATATDI